jgi:hypothetical protein
VISFTEKEPKVDGQSSSAAEKEVQVTVTGLDEKGQMFRENAPIIELDGRNCHFHSKFRPELGSWVLVEFDSPKFGAKKTTVQGQVKSAQSDVLSANLHRIHVELETAQVLKISPALQPAKAAAPAAQPAIVPVPTPAIAPTAKTGAFPSLSPKEAPAAPITRLKPEARTDLPYPTDAQATKAAPPVVREVLAPKFSADTIGLDKEAAKAAIAQEVKDQMAAFKSTFSEELERIALRMVSSSLEPIVRQAIEKQIATNFQSSIQTLNGDLTLQLAGHLAQSKDLQESIENLTKKVLDEEIERARTSTNQDLLNPGERVAEAQQVLEKSIAEMEDRLKAAREAANATMNGVQAMDREITDSTAQLQKTVDQLNQAARSTIEKFDTNITAQLSLWTAQFKSHVDGISQEKIEQLTSGLEQQLSSQMREATEREISDSTARVQTIMDDLNQAARSTIEKFDTHMTVQLNSWSAQFKSHVDSVSLEKIEQLTIGLEQLLASQRQESNEVIEKLSAGLQLAQGTLRVQETRLTERSQALAAEFEKEIKSVLFRLAGEV